MIKKFLKQQIEKRKYIRHPAEISVEYRISGEQEVKINTTKDISFGGLCFQGQSYIEPGTTLKLKFPSIHAEYEVTGRVAWCSRKKGYVEMGLEFLDENEAYRATLIEEICHLKNQQRVKRVIDRQEF